MRVRLEKPGLKHETKFLRASRESRQLHKSAVSPPRTPDQFRSYLRSLRKSNRESWLVVTREESGLAGVVNASEIVRGCFQSAYLGYYAFVPYAGAGLMREGLGLVIGQCFRELKLHRLEANIQPWNERSVALVAGLGFSLEGYSRRYLKVSGRWQDHERWAILAEDWRAARSG